jgi:ketosteroid isomerase-like protein
MPLSTAFRVRLNPLFAGVAAASCLFLFSTPASADALSDAGALIKQGKYAQAQDVLDKVLAQKSSDPQARFLKGIALTEQGKTEQAISVFQKLTEEYPTLPEPYNNLAVIYAQQKQYEKAKSALETAIRTHPAYATAHENLGDIYTRLATQAYDKALQLDSANASAQQKLALIRDLTGSPTRIAKAPEPSKPATVIAAAPTPPVVTPPAVVAPIEPVKPTVKPSPTPPAPPVVVEPTKPVVATKSDTKPDTKTEPKSDSKAVTSAVEAWASAWSRKDVKGYLAAYARDFKVPGGKSRSAWETERRQRIDKPGTISVKVSGVKVTMDGEKAVVSFRQSYNSGKLDVNTSKRLDMVRRDGRWQIVQESVSG